MLTMAVRVRFGGLHMRLAIHEGASGEDRARALSLLREALEIIDSLGEHPEIGARLNDVIESLGGDRDPD